MRSRTDKDYVAGLTAPRDRNRRVSVIAVVISCADLPNWASRFVTLSETLKKSIASHVHANHLGVNRIRINTLQEGDVI
jgi:hypothetical protein